MLDYGTLLYGKNVDIVGRERTKTVYQMRHDVGDAGRMVSYELFPGVQLTFCDMRGESMYTHGCHMELLELSYCTAGRYECEYGAGNFVYMGENEIAVNRVCPKQVSSSFPLGYWKGVCVLLDPEMAQRHLTAHYPELELDVSKLIERLCPAAECHIFREETALNALFRRFYERTSGDVERCYRIRTLELLAYLSDWQPALRPHGYLTRDRAALMKHICGHLQRDLRQELTLAELAREHDIGLTALKHHFSMVYGMSPGAYRRQYRMQAAAEMLRRDGCRVVDVANAVGYENASKFSAAFRDVFGMSPAEYRKNGRPFGAEEGSSDEME